MSGDMSSWKKHKGQKRQKTKKKTTYRSVRKEARQANDGEKTDVWGGELPMMLAVPGDPIMSFVPSKVATVVGDAAYWDGKEGS